MSSLQKNASLLDPKIEGKKSAFIFVLDLYIYGYVPALDILRGILTPPTELHQVMFLESQKLLALNQSVIIIFCRSVAF